MKEFINKEFLINKGKWFFIYTRLKHLIDVSFGTRWNTFITIKFYITWCIPYLWSTSCYSNSFIIPIDNPRILICYLHQLIITRGLAVANSSSVSPNLTSKTHCEIIQQNFKRFIKTTTPNHSLNRPFWIKIILILHLQCIYKQLRASG